MLQFLLLLFSCFISRSSMAHLARRKCSQSRSKLTSSNVGSSGHGQVSTTYSTGAP